MTETFQELREKYCLSIEEIFDLAHQFFVGKYRDHHKIVAEKADKAFHLSFDDRIEMASLICLKKYGKYDPSKANSPGFLDFIGHKRISRWHALGDMDPNDAVVQFVNHLCRLCPIFLTYLEAYSRNREPSNDLFEKQSVNLKTNEQTHFPEDVEKYSDPHTFVKQNETLIRQALNSQTEQQFHSYAEMYFPDDPDKRSELIAQLQERHFREYLTYIERRYELTQSTKMNKLNQNDLKNNQSNHVNNYELPTPDHLINHECEKLLDDNIKPINSTSLSSCSQMQYEPGEKAFPNGHIVPNECIPNACNTKSSSSVNKTPVPDEAIGATDVACELDLSHGNETETHLPLLVHSPSIWTRGQIEEFKHCLSEDEESVIQIRCGEIFSVRVQTHPSGSRIAWEFATDDYDIGFGLFFEWINPTSATSSHSNSPTITEEKSADQSSQSELLVEEIIPVNRRNSHLEVCCGSHPYPGVGTYVFKFDNSFSVWRSKKLYYRVCYTS